jgi:hypothetical protein
MVMVGELSPTSGLPPVPPPRSDITPKLLLMTEISSSTSTSLPGADPAMASRPSIRSSDQHLTPTPTSAPTAVDRDDCVAQAVVREVGVALNTIWTTWRSPRPARSSAIRRILASHFFTKPETISMWCPSRSPPRS